MCWVGAHPYPPSILCHSFLFFGNFATQIVGFIDATISLSRWEWILFARMDPRFVGMFLPRGRPIGICEMISLYLKRLIWRMAPPSTGVFHVAVKIDASILFPLSIATAFQASFQAGDPRSQWQPCKPRSGVVASEATANSKRFWWRKRKGIHVWR